MKTKSKLVLGLSILSAATMASATTATFAWYQSSSSVGGGNLLAHSTFSVYDKTTNVGGILINVQPQASLQTDLVVTNRSGRSYYIDKNSDQHEIMADDFGLGSGKKMGQMHFVVTITAQDEHENPIDLTTAQIKAVAGQSGLTKYVKATAAGSVKIDLTKTESLKTEHNGATDTFNDYTKVDFHTDNDANPESAKPAYGVLGAAADASVALMKITFGTDGKIYTYVDSGTWAEGTKSEWTIGTVSEHAGCEARNTAEFYYALEAKASGAEASPEIAATNTITPDVVASI